MGKRVSEEAYRARWQIGAMASGKATHDAVNSWHEDFRGDLPKIDVPLLIMQGDQDRVLPPPSSGLRLAPMLPTATWIYLKDAPHGIPWTHAQDVNKAMLDIFRRPAMARR